MPIDLMVVSAPSSESGDNDRTPAGGVASSYSRRGISMLDERLALCPRPRIEKADDKGDIGPGVVPYVMREEVAKLRCMREPGRLVWSCIVPSRKYRQLSHHDGIVFSRTTVWGEVRCCTVLFGLLLKSMKLFTGISKHALQLSIALEQSFVVLDERL